MTESEYGVKRDKNKTETKKAQQLRSKDKARMVESASLSFYAIFVYIPVLAPPPLPSLPPPNLPLTLLSRIELLPIFQNPHGFTFSDIGLTPHAKPRDAAGRG